MRSFAASAAGEVSRGIHAANLDYFLPRPRFASPKETGLLDGERSRDGWD
jgi:hypothetical protein